MTLVTPSLIDYTDKERLFLVVNTLERHSTTVEHEVEVTTFTTLSALLSHGLSDLELVQTIIPNHVIIIGVTPPTVHDLQINT